MTSNIVFLSAQHKEVMRISAYGVTVAPDITVNEATKAVIAAFDCHIKNMLESERERRIEAQTENEVLKAKLASAELSKHRAVLDAKRQMQSCEVAYLYTNVQSGDVVASTDPDWADDDRQMWHKEPLFKRG